MLSIGSTIPDFLDRWKLSNKAVESQPVNNYRPWIYSIEREREREKGQLKGQEGEELLFVVARVSLHYTK